MVDNLKYTVKPSKPDSRDFVYVQKKSTIRPYVDLRKWDSPVEDQSNLGSCVANAIASAYELQVNRLFPEYFVELSRLFIYYNARLFDNTVKEDVGAYIRDGLKAVKMYGVCTEALWPYDIDKFDDQPPPECYAEATKRMITEYNSLNTLRDMLETLSNNVPIVIGISVYESFEGVDKESSIVPLPTDSDYYIGGHAVTIVGYNLIENQFLIKNSYGTDWGDNGYAWLPFEYLRTEGFEKWRFDINNQIPILPSNEVVTQSAIPVTVDIIEAPVQAIPDSIKSTILLRPLVRQISPGQFRTQHNSI